MTSFIFVFPFTFIECVELVAARLGMLSPLQLLVSNDHFLRCGVDLIGDPLL